MHIYVQLSLKYSAIFGITFSKVLLQLVTMGWPSEFFSVKVFSSPSSPSRWYIVRRWHSWSPDPAMFSADARLQTPLATRMSRVLTVLLFSLLNNMELYEAWGVKLWTRRSLPDMLVLAIKWPRESTSLIALWASYDDLRRSLTSNSCL